MLEKLIVNYRISTIEDGLNGVTNIGDTVFSCKDNLYTGIKFPAWPPLPFNEQIITEDGLMLVATISKI